MTPPGTTILDPAVAGVGAGGAGALTHGAVDAAAGLSPQPLSALEQLIAAKRRRP